eukprot:jgi/Orpsp1_1/1184666/evm.model.c7180000090457.1
MNEGIALGVAIHAYNIRYKNFFESIKNFKEKAFNFINKERNQDLNEMDNLRKNSENNENNEIEKIIERERKYREIYKEEEENKNALNDLEKFINETNNCYKNFNERYTNFIKLLNDEINHCNKTNEKEKLTESNLKEILKPIYEMEEINEVKEFINDKELNYYDGDSKNGFQINEEDIKTICEKFNSLSKEKINLFKDFIEINKDE